MVTPNEMKPTLTLKPRAFNEIRKPQWDQANNEKHECMPGFVINLINQLKDWI